MLRLDSAAATLVLASVVALGPLATDMYLPALPAIGAALGVGTDQVQLTLSVYVLAFALAQLVCGPLSDRFGRKPVLIGGMLIFALASLACAFVDSITGLIAMRFLQALGGATGPVLGRAAVRDIHGPHRSARILARLAMVMALAPAIAPIIGGFMVAALGWQSVFIVLAGYACAAALLFALAMPEPLRPEHRQSIRPLAILRNYRQLLRHRRFIGYTMANAFAFAGLFAFLSGAAFVLIDFLGVPTQHFGFYFALMVLGYIAGNLLTSQIGHRFDQDRMILSGCLLNALAGIGMAVLALSEAYHVAAIVVPMMLFSFSVGIVLPQSVAAALGPFPQIAGSASALMGFVQMVIAAIAGIVVGHLHDGTSLVMALVIAVTGIAAPLAFLVLVRADGSVAMPLEDIHTS